MSEDKRIETRVPRDETMMIEVISSSYDESLPGRVVECATSDISPNGLQVKIPYEVVEGAILDLCVEMKRTSKRFYLTGEVKWVKKHDDEVNWHVGFLLFDGVNTDIEAWKALF